MAKLFSAFIAVLVVSVGLLMVGGVVLDVVQHRGGYHYGFFRYRINAFNNIPFWFLAVLAQIAMNGLWIKELSRIVGETEFSPFREKGRVSWNVPVQYSILFGKNLALVVGIIFVFMVLQSTRL